MRLYLSIFNNDLFLQMRNVRVEETSIDGDADEGNLDHQQVVHDQHEARHGRPANGLDVGHGGGGPVGAPG